MLVQDLETNFELTLIKELNSAKVSAEEHAANVINELDKIISLMESGESGTIVKGLLFQIMDDMQFQDLNRQKIERVMNLLIEKHQIPKETLEEAKIKTSPSAHHIDHEDGDCVSDEELAKMILEMKSGTL